MARPVEIDIIKHMPLKDLDRIAKEYEKKVTGQARLNRMHNRLFFVKLRYHGTSVEEASSIVGFTTMTGYNVQKLWNEGGIAALEPNFGGGKPSKLNDEQKEMIRETLRLTPMSTKEMKAYIKEAFDVDYSEKQVHVILTDMGMIHAKAYEEHPYSKKKKDQKKVTGMLWIP